MDSIKRLMEDMGAALAAAGLDNECARVGELVAQAGAQQVVGAGAASGSDGGGSGPTMQDQEERPVKRTRLSPEDLDTIMGHIGDSALRASVKRDLAARLEG